MSVLPCLHLLRIIWTEQSTPNEQTQYPLSYLLLGLLNNFTAESSGFVELQSLFCLSEKSINHAAMEMQVGIERRAKTMDIGYTAVSGRRWCIRTLLPQGTLYNPQSNL
jgi:hypothetical protein